VVNYTFSAPNKEWLDSFFGVMSSYYAQQFFFTIKGHLRRPTTSRVKKLSLISMSSLFVLYSSIGNHFTLDYFNIFYKACLFINFLFTHRFDWLLLFGKCLHP
jgi:hypothetical protein